MLASRRGQDASDAHPRRDVLQVLVARHLHGDRNADDPASTCRRHLLMLTEPRQAALVASPALDERKREVQGRSGCPT